MSKRRNSINDQWSARRREMPQLPAYRVLSQSAHRVMSRIELELCYHGGNDNGQLPVTFENFVEYGVDRASVAPAQREGEALGFWRITDRGRGGNCEHRAPHKFYLTFAIGRGSRANPPTDDWRKIKTIEEAHGRLRAWHAQQPINVLWCTAKNTRKNGEKNRNPVREFLKFRYGKPTPKMRKPRCGNPALQGHLRIPYYFLYLR